MPGGATITPTDRSDNVISAGTAQVLTIPGLTTSIGGAVGTYTFGPISVASTSFLFWYVSVGGVTGGATTPTIDFYFDYLGPDGSTVIGSGVVHLTQFTGAGGTFSNIGPAPIAGGGGFVVPTLAQIRAVVGSVSGSPTFTGVKMFLIGR